jgi:hypothetical protein
LRDQFTSLRRRVHSQGRESVDASSASAHEDVANAAAGALVLAGAASPFEDEGIGISECFVRGHGAPGYDDDFEVEQPSLVFGGVA